MNILIEEKLIKNISTANPRPKTQRSKDITWSTRCHCFSTVYGEINFIFLTRKKFHSPHVVSRNRLLQDSWRALPISGLTTKQTMIKVRNTKSNEGDLPHPGYPTSMPSPRNERSLSTGASIRVVNQLQIPASNRRGELSKLDKNFAIEDRALLGSLR